LVGNIRKRNEKKNVSKQPTNNNKMETKPLWPDFCEHMVGGGGGGGGGGG
jgi:hypothetical protein